MSFRYQTGGSLPLGSPTYIKRQADEDLYQALMDGQFCYVLTSRQMGKSSLRVQVMQRLKDAGLKCSSIDLTGIGSKTITPDQWYYGILKHILKDLNLGEVFDIKSFWRERQELGLFQRLSEFVDVILLNHLAQPLVVFVDEIDSTISLPFSSDDFFAWIRYCYNLRADCPQYQQLTFCLLGVATPNDLIQDEMRTPFNLGTKINLERFKKDQLTPLLENLSDRIDNLIEVMDEIYQWTGGQPFLTQRLCRLIQESPVEIRAGESNKIIWELVHDKIIDNWEIKDEQFHLETICKRLLTNDEHTLGVLFIYQKILAQRDEGLLLSNESLSEIVALKLTGIVVSEGRRLLPYNRIYQEIFSRDWVKQKLSKLRPYGSSLALWSANNQDKAYLLVGKSFEEANQWALARKLSEEDYQYLTASQKLDTDKVRAENNQIVIQAKKTANQITAIGASILFIGTISTFQIYQRFASCPYEEGRPGERVGNVCFRNLKTSGEVNLFLSSTNFHLNKGIDAFKKGDYDRAIRLFEQAVDGDHTDPVPQIFLNNAKARQRGNLIKLAVATSIDYYEIGAKDVLRGVADAQDEFNKSQAKLGDRYPFLEIVIANDENAPEAARKVAQDLVEDKSILGIMGHHSSESTIEAQKIYEQAEIAVISSTSSSSELSKYKHFFRTVGSTKKAAKLYAEYISNEFRTVGSTKKAAKVFVFYKKDSGYSRQLKEDFKAEFKGKILNGGGDGVDISDDNFNTKEELRKIAKSNQSQVVLLFTNIATNSIAISASFAIDKINKELPASQKLKMLAAMSLTETDTIEKGGKAIEGLILVRPFLSRTSKYTTNALQRWQLKEINWRTATSYDAIQAFGRAINLSRQKSRKEILRHLGLPSFGLNENETSGVGLKWDSSDRSNENRQYGVVKIKDGKFVDIYKDLNSTPIKQK